MGFDLAFESVQCMLPGLSTATCLNGSLSIASSTTEDASTSESQLKSRRRGATCVTRKLVGAGGGLGGGTAMTLNEVDGPSCQPSFPFTVKYTRHVPIGAFARICHDAVSENPWPTASVCGIISGAKSSNGPATLLAPGSRAVRTACMTWNGAPVLFTTVAVAVIVDDGK